MKKELIIKEVKNSGLIVAEDPKEDYNSKLFERVGQPVLGAVSPLKEPPIIFPDGVGWLGVAKEYGLPEIQFNPKFDTYSCVVFAIAKALCYYLFKVYGLKTTVSEMYNAYFAGVVANQGTTVSKGFRSFYNHGWVDDKDYPFTPETTAAQFYIKPPKYIKIMAEGKLTEWEFHFESLPRDLQSIFRAYSRTPVVLTGYAWAHREGIYFDNNNRANHAFIGLGPEDADKRPKSNNICDDTYPKTFGNYISPEELEKDELFKTLHYSFKYGSAHHCWVTPKKNNKLTIKSIINMLKKVSRDAVGGFWFIKEVDGKPHKQKITNWSAMLGSLIDEIGVEKNNLSNEQLAAIPDYQFFK